MRSVLTNLLEILQTVVVVVSFIVTVMEAIYEGIAKAGEQKKKEALAAWAQVKPILRQAIASTLGERWAGVFERIFSDAVVGFIIDLLVAWFNRNGLFPKSS